MCADFVDVVGGRHSVRAFKDTPVPRDVIEDICRTARMAPSGANLQPGQFHVLTGNTLSELKSALSTAVDDNRAIDTQYSYFPQKMSTELKERQREAGFALYSALGISRRDVDARRQQFARNYAFFDAPIGVVVTIDRDMGKGCFMDLGMALQTFFLAARNAGLGCTGIGALANYARVVHETLELPETQMVVCGIALGYADAEHPANSFRTDRMPLDEFTTFRGF